jgi:ABC-type multidrug transport system fused ATPase/permease subunit
MCVSSLQSVGSVYSGLMQGVGAAEKVFEFIDRQPTMVHDGSLAPDHLEGRVDFENVTFTYRTRPHTQVLQVRGAQGLPEFFPLASGTSCTPGPGTVARNT